MNSKKIKKIIVAIAVFVVTVILGYSISGVFKSKPDESIIPENDPFTIKMVEAFTNKYQKDIELVELKTEQSYDSNKVGGLFKDLGSNIEFNIWYDLDSEVITDNYHKVLIYDDIMRALESSKEGLDCIKSVNFELLCAAVDTTLPLDVTLEAYFDNCDSLVKISTEIGKVRGGVEPSEFEVVDALYQLASSLSENGIHYIIECVYNDQKLLLMEDNNNKLQSFDYYNSKINGFDGSTEQYIN